VTSKYFLLLVLSAAVFAGGVFSAPVTVKGYVLDSACAFTKGLDKPLAENAPSLARTPDRNW
jgi:hypothetical protein